jgi:hypothetical protein
MRKKLRSARRASPNGTPQPLPRKVGVGSPLSRICTLASPGVVTVVAEAKSKCQELRRHSQRSSAGQTSLSSSVRPDGQMENSRPKMPPVGQLAGASKSQGLK